MKTKILLLFIFFVLSILRVDAKGQEPARPWQWLEFNNRCPFTRLPGSPWMTERDNIPAFLRSYLFLFKDDAMEKFRQDGGLVVSAKRKKSPAKYYIDKYGHRFEMKWNEVMLLHPRIAKKEERALNMATFVLKIPVKDSAAIIGLAYRFLNDVYDLKAIFYLLAIGNNLSDPKLREQNSLTVGGGWYGLQTGVLTTSTDASGKSGKVFRQFRPVLDKAVSLPGFLIDISAEEFDYTYGFTAALDKKGEFYIIEYIVSCRFFGNLPVGSNWKKEGKRMKDDFNYIVGAEAEYKKMLAALKINPPLLSVKTVLTR